VFAASVVFAQDSAPSHSQPPTTTVPVTTASPAATRAEQGNPQLETVAERAGERGKEADREVPSEENEMPHELLWKWLNFAVLAGGLGYLIGQNAGPFFKSRSEEIQKGIRDAAAIRADAEARAADIERRVANFSSEVEQLRRQSREEIASEGARLSAETARLIEKIQAQAEQDIDAAATQASHQLAAYSAELAIKLAEQQIRDRMTPAEQNAQVEQFVGDLRGKAALN
jgi:F-type H+-transporting ATPase subunit b